VFEKSFHGNETAHIVGKNAPVGKFLLVFGSLAAPGRAFATPMLKALTEVGGMLSLFAAGIFVFVLFVASYCQRGTCLALLDVDDTSPRLPLYFDGSRSQPSPYEVCLGCKGASSIGRFANRR
jgi:hypothetical protein